LTLHPNLIVRLLEPGTKLVIDVGSRPHADVMDVPARTKRFVLDDSPTLDGPAKRETGNEVILSRRQTREAHTGHTDQTRLLRKNLNVPERMKHPDVPSGEPHGSWIGASEECVQGKSPA
jgi:hypothetical protein